MQKFLIAIILLLQGHLLSGQDMLGMVNSNYSGVYGVGLNPSNMVANRLYMDINLIGVQGFVENNYIYIQRDEFFTLVRDRKAPLYYTSEDEARNFNIYRNNSTKHGFQNVTIQGPSAMVVDGRHAYGVSTAFRSVASFSDLPPEIAIFIYEAIDYEFQHNIEYDHTDNIKINSMAWMEIGFSYAYNFHRHRYNYWSAGITVKPLFGLAGMYASVDDLRYEVHNDDSTSIYNASFEYGMAVPVNFDNNDFQNPTEIRGMGLGFDLGLTYQRTEKGHSTAVYSRICEQPFEEYNYRIGFSLLDLGYIRFDKNSIREIYTSTATEWHKPADTLDYSSTNDVLERISDYFLENAEVTESEKAYTQYLAPTISVQADFKLRRGLYMNFTGFYGLNLGNNFLYRPTLIAFTPRYETPRWEVSLPISLYEWEFGRPRVGFFVRYGNVFVGFDRLNTLAGINNFDGIDFYAGIRLNLSKAFKMNFIKGNCGGRNMYNIETFDYRNF